jgi:hypothetical protein
MATTNIIFVTHNIEQWNYFIWNNEVEVFTSTAEKFRAEYSEAWVLISCRHFPIGTGISQLF